MAGIVEADLFDVEGIAGSGVVASHHIHFIAAGIFDVQYPVVVGIHRDVCGIDALEGDGIGSLSGGLIHLAGAVARDEGIGIIPAIAVESVARSFRNKGVAVGSAIDRAAI